MRTGSGFSCGLSRLSQISTQKDRPSIQIGGLFLRKDHFSPHIVIPAEAKRRAGTSWNFTEQGPRLADAIGDCLFVMCKYGWAG